MTIPVDLTGLREMTDGDVELEKILFQEFMESAEKCLANMADADSQNWQASAHAFKGISLTLGANKLGELCKLAQENSAAAAPQKQALFDAISHEYKQVKDYLQSLAG